MVWEGAVTSDNTGESVWISQADPLGQGSTATEPSDKDVFRIDRQGCAELFDGLKNAFFGQDVFR
jgi:hypothetical protein